MTTDKTPATLATVKHGGCVQLGDGLPPLPKAGYVTGGDFGHEAHNAFTPEQMREYALAALSAQPSPFETLPPEMRSSSPDYLEYLDTQPSPGGQDALAEAVRRVISDVDSGDYHGEISEATYAALEAALAARQPVRIYGCCDQPEGELHTAECPNMRHLAARQPVREPVADAGRSAAYDAIDRFLRNNMDDEAYAAYVEHLEALWAAVPAQSVNTPQPVAFDYPKFKAIGMGCVLEDQGVHFLIDAAQCGFDEALGQMKATLESIGPLYAAPTAQAVDLAEFKALYRAYVRLLESGRDRIIDLGGTCDPVDVMEANDVDLQAARRVIDSQAVGNG